MNPFMYVRMYCISGSILDEKIKSFRARASFRRRVLDDAESTRSTILEDSGRLGNASRMIRNQDARRDSRATGAALCCRPVCKTILIPRSSVPPSGSSDPLRTRAREMRTQPFNETSVSPRTSLSLAILHGYEASSR